MCAQVAISASQGTQGYGARTMESSATFFKTLFVGRFAKIGRISDWVA